MTRRLTLAGPGNAPGLAAFLTRQLRWDKSAVVRLRASDGVLAAFTRPARFEVLAVRPGRLEPEDDGTRAADTSGAGTELDTTVSAGQLLDGIDEAAGTVAVPPAVTGPPWAGVLPPRGNWERLAEPEAATLRTAASAVIDEFRRRTEQLDQQKRTRDVLDALAEEIWDRPCSGTPLPLRVVHAAQALGFLRVEEPAAVLGSGSWLRLRTAHGSVAVRRAGRPGLSLTPL